MNNDNNIIRLIHRGTGGNKVGYIRHMGLCQLSHHAVIKTHLK